MVIGPEYVYVAVPRTASKSTSAWLVENYSGKYYGKAHHSTHVPGGSRKKCVFAVVRDPYERMRSYYVMSQRPGGFGPPYFEAFVRWCRYGLPSNRSQVAMLKTVNVPLGDLLILRYETLVQDMQQLPFLQPWVDLPVLNASESKKPELTVAAIKAINRHSAEDFDRFGYTRLTV